MFTQFKISTLPARLKQLWKPFRLSFKSFSRLFAIGLSLSLIVAACSPNSPSSPSASSSATPSSKTTISATTVRIGYQKAATILSSLKTKGTLEKAFAASGSTVTWTEFPAGPPMLEALNAGSIDFGYTGETPPIIAQATGVPVRYVAYDPWGTKAEAIVVPKNSPIKTVADLKGKKVGVAKGSNTHYLLVSALLSANLTPNDIEFAFLKPADARAAFEGKNIDAWSIWDPYLAVAEEKAGGRILVDANGLAPNRGYYLASQGFIDKSSDALKLVLDEVKKESDWAKSNPTEVAKFLAPALGIDAAVLEKAERRREYGVLPLPTEVISEQQKIADTFEKLKLIPKPIKIEEAVWKGST
jgi:sulfonate transport system substrate-binding protein